MSKQLTSQGLRIGPAWDARPLLPYFIPDFKTRRFLLIAYMPKLVGKVRMFTKWHSVLMLPEGAESGARC